MFQHIRKTPDGRTIRCGDVFASPTGRIVVHGFYTRTETTQLKFVQLWKETSPGRFTRIYGALRDLTSPVDDLEALRRLLAQLNVTSSAKDLASEIRRRLGFPVTQAGQQLQTRGSAGRSRRSHPPARSGTFQLSRGVPGSSSFLMAGDAFRLNEGGNLAVLYGFYVSSTRPGQLKYIVFYRERRGVFERVQGALRDLGEKIVDRSLLERFSRHLQSHSGPSDLFRAVQRRLDDAEALEDLFIEGEPVLEMDDETEDENERLKLEEEEEDANGEEADEVQPGDFHTTAKLTSDGVLLRSGTVWETTKYGRVVLAFFRTRSAIERNFMVREVSPGEFGPPQKFASKQLIERATDDALLVRLGTFLRSLPDQSKFPGLLAEVERSLANKSATSEEPPAEKRQRTDSGPAEISTEPPQAQAARSRIEEMSTTQIASWLAESESIAADEVPEVGQKLGELDLDGATLFAGFGLEGGPTFIQRTLERAGLKTKAIASLTESIRGMAESHKLRQFTNHHGN